MSEAKQYIFTGDPGFCNFGMALTRVDNGLVAHGKTWHLFDSLHDLTDYPDFIREFVRRRGEIVEWITACVRADGGNVLLPVRAHIKVAVIEDQIVMRKKKATDPKTRWCTIAMEFLLHAFFAEHSVPVIKMSPLAYKTYFDCTHDNKKTKEKMGLAIVPFFDANMDEQMDSHTPIPDKPHIYDAAGMGRFYWEHYFFSSKK